MPERITEHYQRHAHAFDRDRSRHFIERLWVERFIMPLSRGGAILDLGCGGGEPVARFLIDQGFQLTGVDSAATMIELARTRFPRHRWLNIDMRTLAITDRFDGVIALNSLFHLAHDDQEAVIARVETWLKPGGRFLFNAGPSHGVSIGEYRGDPLFHASLDPAEYRAAFARAGLAEMAYVAEDPDCGGATVWLARKI